MKITAAESKIDCNDQTKSFNFVKNRSEAENYRAV